MAGKQTMMNFVSGIWSKLLAALAVVGGALAAIALLRKSGKDAERASHLEQVAASRRKADEISARVEAMSGAELERMRRSAACGDWRRDCRPRAIAG